MDDIKLWIDGLRKGNMHAYEQIYRAYYKALCVFATQILDIADAEEVVDDVIFKLWQHREKLPEQLSLQSYLYKSVRNGCLNALKNSRSGRNLISLEIMLDKIELFDRVLAEGNEPLDILINKELEPRIQEAIHRLPEKCREAFLLNLTENMTYKQIAEHMGISINTVKYHIKTAYRLLREDLGDLLPLLLLLMGI